MPQQNSSSVTNSFIGGLKTEFTALNFPENAATDTDNCVYTLIGEVTRRDGIDLEENFAYTNITAGETGAVSSYKWTNVGGDGLTQIYVLQVGTTLYFFRYSDATTASPMSTTKLLSQTTGLNIDGNIELQYADGNGYLFFFHPTSDPYYCTYNAGVITLTPIFIKVRDFDGIPELGIADQSRPTTLSDIHQYNIQNQGWSAAPTWATTSTTSVNITLGAKTFTVAASLPVTIGQIVQINANIRGASIALNGSVTSYSGTSLAVNVTSMTNNTTQTSWNDWNIFPFNAGLINTWHTAEGNYPSNADIWWRFKNATGVFDPTTTQPNVTLDSGPAPKGFYIFNPFVQDRVGVSGLPTLDLISTSTKPKTGTWFQGRLWFSGVDAAQQAHGNAPYYTWTENIYFSQVSTNATQFGNCYQVNDPTSEDFFDLLPTDGGVITIQGAGSINKLYPIQNGLLVFASNGIWFITGSQGIGFAANDYTITKISNVQTISATSFVNILGYPMFWNVEGIYKVSPSQEGLSVDNLCLGTILSFYSQIPHQSKRYARGDYDPNSFVVTWLFKSGTETSITDRYLYDRALNYNISSKAFYPYTFPTTGMHIHDVKYIVGPGGSNAPDPTFKYFVSDGTTQMSFAEERDNTHWRDFYSVDNMGSDYDSYFVTGQRLHGKALTKFQPGYVIMYSRSDVPTAYRIQGIWDFAINGSSGRFSSVQEVSTGYSNFGNFYHKHKIRGRGYSFQIKVQSVENYPFNIIGWAQDEMINAQV